MICPLARLLSPTTLRIVVSLSVLGLLAACSGGGPTISATQEARQYQAHAKRNYIAPGPPADPWGPYIYEASVKYDVPELWIRSVMRQESGGQEYLDGELITSPAGAMGLMQVMPETYDDLRGRYSLGDDPYDPHDNIMAGGAYLRELYDAYGSPAFLAAYNAGPGRLDDYLTHNKPLPDETRHYVLNVGTMIADSTPERPSAAGQLAMNQLPLNIPPGPRYPRGRYQQAPVVLADNRGLRGNSYARVAVQSAPLPEPPLPVPAPRVVVASAQPRQRGGFHLIAPAMAESLPRQRGGSAAGNWAIQVGAFGNEGMARAAVEAAREHVRPVLSNARAIIGTVHQSSATLYRARLTGLSREAAVEACEKLSRGRGACIVLSPDAQS